MTKVYILKNQHNLYLSKQKEWIAPTDAPHILRTPHKDEAINLKVEYSVRHPELRLELVHCSINTKGNPELTNTASAEQASALPESQPEPSSPLAPQLVSQSTLLESTSLENPALDDTHSQNSHLPQSDPLKSESLKLEPPKPDSPKTSPNKADAVQDAIDLTVSLAATAENVR